MIDTTKILEDLKRQARDVMADLDVDARVDDAKTAAGEVRERLRTEPQARNVAAGAGGLLLLGLLGSKGGRKLMGSVAKTGAAAAIGALAYRTWSERRGAGANAAADDAPPRDFMIEAEADPGFSRAIVRTMIAAAYADGAISAEEEKTVAEAIDAHGLGAEARALLLPAENEAALFDEISAAATTPNRAVQLYAAAVVAGDDDDHRGDAFLERLRVRLGVDQAYAEAMRRA